MIRIIVKILSLFYQTFVYGRSSSKRTIGTRVSDTNYPFY